MRLTGLLLEYLTISLRMAPAQSPNTSESPHSFIAVDGSRLYYQECGSGPRALLLLHDGVVNSAIWDDVWPTFCKKFHVIRYDRRGYGSSPATTKPYFEVDDVAAVLHDRKVTQVALLGSSHGGNVAMNFALRYPAQVSDLTWWDPKQKVSHTLNTS